MSPRANSNLCITSMDGCGRKGVKAKSKGVARDRFSRCGGAMIAVSNGRLAGSCACTGCSFDNSSVPSICNKFGIEIDCGGFSLTTMFSCRLNNRVLSAGCTAVVDVARFNCTRDPSLLGT